MQTRASPVVLALALLAYCNASVALDAFQPPVMGPAWSDAHGWDAPEYYTTIRAMDFNGDGLDDLCARGSAGVICAFSNGSGFDEAQQMQGFSDQCCNQPEYYLTIRVLEAANRDYYCIRGRDGTVCMYQSGFGFAGSGFTDNAGWNEPDHYNTLVMANINNDEYADVCGRSSLGMRCYRKFAPESSPFESTAIIGPAWSDASGWDEPYYYLTIRALDFNGDGRDDLCARSSESMACYPSTGDGFGAFVEGPAWRDLSGWRLPQYYDTIRALDFNGDGKDDLCARNSTGMGCHASTGTSFEASIAGPAWRDSSGWNLPRFYRTIRVMDFNGDGLDDLCARSSLQFDCYPSTGTGFGPSVSGPQWSDAAGWDQPQYYETILKLDFNGDGFDDICTRSGLGMLCYASNAPLFRDRFET
jgi:hypothetical protein